MATVLTLNVRTNRVSVLSVSLYFLGNYIFLTTKRDLCDSTLFSQIPSPFHYRSIVCPQFFISIPLARDYYGYYDYHYSYYDEYSRSQWISRLQFYWNFELTPRVRSENEVDLTCLWSWHNLPDSYSFYGCAATLNCRLRCVQRTKSLQPYDQATVTLGLWFVELP